MLLIIILHIFLLVSVNLTEKISVIKCVKIDPNNELDKKLYETLTNSVKLGFGEFGYEGTVLPIHYEDIADQCENLKVENSDIFVMSYPKTGTTWCQEMVWMIVNNLDFEGGKVPLAQRFPFLEISGLFSPTEVKKIDPNFQLSPALENSVKFVNLLTVSPRLIKTHLPWSLLPKQIRKGDKSPKIIYATRNVKDTCVSYYYNSILFGGFLGDFDTFCKLFKSGKVIYGNYYNHVNGFWQHRNDPNILIIRYEDMKKDLPSIIRKVAVFLGKSLTDDQVTALTHHLSFENMKNNPAVNHSEVPLRKFYSNNADGIRFMRSGIVGSYKKDMTPEIEKDFDDWIEEHERKTGIKGCSALRKE